MGLRRDLSSRLMAIAGVLLLAAAIAIIAYYAITVPVEGSFGERYVTTVVSPPYPLNELTTFKPVTLITYFIFAGTIFLLESTRGRLSFGTRGLRTVVIVASFAAGYEFLWNMFAWFTTWLKDGGTLDLIANTFHNHTFPPVNFNFATKTSFLVFALCLYVWHFLEGIDSGQKSVSK